MPLDKKSIEVLTRPLKDEDIKSRAGKAGMNFRYVSPDFVIKSLNEAFEHHWDTQIFYQNVHDNAAVVGLRLVVPTAQQGTFVSKEQFGSCDITKGLGVGDAFKGAASDALKKCATLLGLALELYEKEEPEQGGFRAPSSVPNKNSFQAPNQTKVAGVPPTPPRFPAPPPKPAEAQAPSKPMAPPPFPPKPPAPPAPAKKQANPFAAAGSGDINATMLNSLTNIATRKNLTQSELIALAGIQDEDGRPLTSFEELKYDQAIAVVQAAQR